MRETMHLKAAFALLLLFLLFVAAGQAQPAFRVKDFNTTRSDGTSFEFGPNFFLDSFAAMGGTVFFAASDGIHGFELWRSDGTMAGTRLVADVCPGSCASTPQRITVVGGTVFFVADDGLHGFELWRSDGTAAGTALVKDLIPPDGPAHIHGLAQLNGKLLFAISGLDRRDELWQTDGTAAGTVRVADFEPGSDSVALEPLARLGGKLVFFGNDPAHGREFWVTDGTAAGTALLKDINPGDLGSTPGFREKVAAVAGGKLFFLAVGPEGFELRVTDGTPAGTALVREIAPGPASYVIGGLTARGREVFFFASENGPDLKLWRSDGTAGGTRVVKEVPPKSTFLTRAGGRLYFFAECELWTSDGTEAGTVPVQEFFSSPNCAFEQPYPVADQGGKLLFFANDGSHGRELWQSDGTPAGTTLLADLYPGATSSGGQPGVFAGGRWFFRAKRGEDVGVQLWTSDGTAAGTRMLQINRQQSGVHVSPQGDLQGPRAFFDLGGTLLFQGGDGESGAELARSDGTAAGTVLVKDLRPGPAPSLPGEFTRVGSTIFLRSAAGTNEEKLWKTDGSKEGTELLFSPFHLHLAFQFSPRDLTALGGELLFGGAGEEDFIVSLMKSDGTPEGTRLIEAAPSLSYVTSIVSLRDDLAFFQEDQELWKTDGTEAGTSLLAGAPSVRQTLKELSGVRDGVLLFAGSTPANGEELWRSDGTEAGTYLLAEIVPGRGSKRLGPFAVAGPALFFVAGGDELWKNDAAGTSLVRKLPPGDPAIGIRSLTASGRRVYFTYHDHLRGQELWVSDGTAAGTRIVKDILPGPGSSHPRQLHVEDSVLLFSASDGVHGIEPWRSDGWRRGTRMLQDIAPGALSSSPAEFTASGPNVYFAANDGTGFELWALPRRDL
ncbi:MAG TPA: ELWxxDGT repeat protein [Thermoanaerobaculia bacterium]|jgi:ELWxxDGT repeat protein|nr:ELWxxDGT repeat protein [Thermoanaerobaculia bacterium]